MRRSLFQIGILLAPALLLGGCHTPPHALLSPAAEGTLVTDRTLEDALSTVDGMSLEVISGNFRGSLDEALPLLTRSRVVFVGETHTQYDHHLVQLALLRALQRRHPQLALGVEWFQQDLQQPLDDYLAGRISEAQMLHRTEYYDRWRYDYRLYRPLIEFAKRHRIPLLALNAPAAITRQVGSGGIESLTPEQRAQLPRQLDDSDPTYRQRVRDAYQQHPASGQPFEHFLNVQVVWDESMAANIARFLQTNPDYHVLVLAGTGHAGFRSGIPDRLLRRVPTSTVTIVTVSQEPAQAPEAGSADVLVVSPMLRLPESGKLGVLINSREEQVLVSDVLQTSGAFQAGIRKSDRIVKLDGREIRSFSDLKLALLDKRPGDTVAVEVQSSTQESRQVEVVLQ